MIYFLCDKLRDTPSISDNNFLIMKSIWFSVLYPVKSVERWPGEALYFKGPKKPHMQMGDAICLMLYLHFTWDDYPNYCFNSFFLVDNLGDHIRWENHGYSRWRLQPHNLLDARYHLLKCHSRMLHRTLIFYHNSHTQRWQRDNGLFH